MPDESFFSFLIILIVIWTISWLLVTKRLLFHLKSCKNLLVICQIILPEDYLWNLIPIVVFLKKVLMCFIEKMITLALFAGITKSNFANLSTSDMKSFWSFFSNHWRVLIIFPKGTPFESSVGANWPSCTFRSHNLKSTLSMSATKLIDLP